MASRRRAPSRADNRNRPGASGAQPKRNRKMTVNMEILHRQIDALEKKSLSELQAQFEELYGFVPGDTNAKNLRQRIAYRLQEIMLGGLSEADKALLDRIADADPLANLKPMAGAAQPCSRGTRLKRISVKLFSRFHHNTPPKHLPAGYAVVVARPSGKRQFLSSTAPLPEYPASG